MENMETIETIEKREIDLFEAVILKSLLDKKTVKEKCAVLSSILAMQSKILDVLVKHNPEALDELKETYSGLYD